MDGKHFLLLSELFEQFRAQALLLLKEAEEFGYIDDLTGCYNRKAYEIRKEQLSVVLNICIMFVDLNGLKRVNDIQGHNAGDFVLKDLGKMLKAHFGGNDVFRIGGDEFIVLKVNMTPVTFMLIVNEFQATMNNTHKTNVSIGCGFTSKEKDIDTAIKEAEQIMYANKKEFYKKFPKLCR